MRHEGTFKEFLFFVNDPDSKPKYKTHCSLLYWKKNGRQIDKYVDYRTIA